MTNEKTSEGSIEVPVCLNIMTRGASRAAYASNWLQGRLQKMGGPQLGKGQSQYGPMADSHQSCEPW